MNDVLELDHEDSPHDNVAREGGGLVRKGATEPSTPTGQSITCGLALAIIWWTACTLWAYFVFGELVVVLGYPEMLGVSGVILAFVGAGRRVHSLFPGKVLVAAGTTLLLSAASSVLIPALLVPIVGRRYVTLAGLLAALTVALVVLSVIRARKQAARLGASNAPRLSAVLVWLVILAFTAVAVALATQG